MVKDNHGALWLYVQCGLIEIEASELAKWRADPKVKIKSRVFDRLKGAYPGAKYRAQPLATRAPDGRIWFSTGLVAQAVDPDHLFPNSVVPPVHVEGIIADESMYQPTAPIRLPPRTRNVQIDYTALSLSIPQEVRFRYRLEGRDIAWQDPGTRRQAFYTDLHPGDYTFRVIACNSDGVWNVTGASLPFTVAPAFDQTTWFRYLCILAGAAILWTLYWLRLRQATEQLHERLGARLDERERIARELHDTLLQSFNALLLRLQTVSNVLPARPEEAKKRVDSAIEQAAGAITEGRDALHELRSGGLRTVDISESISSFGKELIASATPQNSPEIRVQAEGALRELNDNVRDEVYRIAVEALRNAFRHAQARQIEAEIKYDDQHFSLHVRDDGKGIDPNVLERGRVPGHWGLHGMRERASLIGGKFEAWSKPDSGTEIELSIPAAIAYEKPSTSRWYLFNRRNRRG
jgi:signal transduction histidine kinase